MWSDSKKICIELINAESEDEVIKILKDHELWEDPSLWRNLGGNDNNYSIVGAQQSDPVAALVEKLVNSVDARLMNECHLEKVDPESDDAPKSVREAVARFIEKSKNPGDSNGRIENWTQTERRENAKKITLAATGSKTSPNFTISDLGEGQTPNDIPSTFMSLNKSNKLKIPFVQGKFNMGGTGVLRFCGDQSIQLLVTRRNPDIVKSALSDDYMWGFTVVRRENPRERKRNSVYRYLAPLENGPDKKNRVLRFESDEIAIFPDANDPYKRKSTYGSLVKLFNYKVKGRSNILMKDGLLSAVGVRLPNPALTMMFHECRNYKGSSGSFHTPFTGLVRLTDDKAKNLEEGFPHDITMTIEKEPLTVKFFGFRPGKADTYRNKSEGLLFVVNGQTHGTLASRFFKRKSVKLSYIADSLLAYVDCSEISRRAQEELFMNTRESLSESELSSKIEEELEKAISDNPLLKDFNNRRRYEKIKNKLENDKPLEDILKNIMEKSSTLSSLFLGGPRLKNPFTTKTVKKGDKFVGKNFPTFFRFKGKPEDFSLERKCEFSRSVRIRFETDVENNYFGRPKDQGKYSITCLRSNEQKDEIPILNHKMNILDGTATLSLDLPKNVKVGEIVSIKISVIDDNRPSPFRNIAKLEVIPKSDQKSSTSKLRSKPPSDDDSDDGEQAPSTFALPSVSMVYENDWTKHCFNKYSALKILLNPNGDGRPVYDFFINGDNFYLLHEMKQAKGSEEVLKEQFRVGIVLIGLALIRDYEHNDNNTSEGLVFSVSDKDNDNNTIEERVSSVSEAISMMLLPIIKSLGNLEEVNVNAQN